jgi:hypothetical protein
MGSIKNTPPTDAAASPAPRPRDRLWRLALWETAWTLLGLAVLYWMIRHGISLASVLVIGVVAIGMGVVWLRLGQALFEASDNDPPSADQNG